MTRTHQLASGFSLLCSVAFSVTGVPLSAQTAESVVLIYSQNRDRASQGTGFLLGNNGLIVTAYHVIQDSEEITVKDSHNHDLEDIRVDQIDPDHDLAVLHTSSEGLVGLRPAAHAPTAQANVSVAGNPRGLQNQLLFGRLTSAGTVPSTAISSANGSRIFARNIEVYPVDVTIYGGMSGAPVLGNDGAVIGVFSGSYAEGRGLGWAIPYKYVQEMIGHSRLGRSPADMAGWPALTLMASSWISLKRSYDHPFDADHIAELDLLGQSMKILRGTWSAKIVSQDKPTFYPYGMGKCEKRTVQTLQLTFSLLDEDGPLIKGRLTQSASSKAFLTPDPLDYAGSNNVENQAQFCNRMLFNDPDIPETSMSIAGSAAFEVADVDEFGDNPRLTTQLNISQCEGVACSASMYGPHTSDNVELLSKDQLRFSKFILTRVSE